jgi:hypothetical protein
MKPETAGRLFKIAQRNAVAGNAEGYEKAMDALRKGGAPAPFLDAGGQLLETLVFNATSPDVDPDNNWL